MDKFKPGDRVAFSHHPYAYVRGKVEGVRDDGWYAVTPDDMPGTSYILKHESELTRLVKRRKGKAVTLNELETLASAATSGPLRIEDWLDQEENRVYVQSEYAVCQNLADAKFIAALDRETVLALIADLKRARD